MADKRRRIGLALGGGGGRGSAHIGVLNALQALDIHIDVLAGTSIGAIVAAFHATGHTPLQIEQWFLKASARGIIDPYPSGGGFLGIRKIQVLLREAFEDRTFADTTIPLSMVAVDLVSGQEVILSEGPLVDALLASSAIPALFPPVMRDDQLLVDGGVLNNVPADIAYASGAGQVIAVDLGAVAPDFSATWLAPRTNNNWLRRTWLPRNQVLIADRSLALMTEWMTLERLKKTPPTVLLRPIVAQLMLFDFGRTVEGRMAGERAAFHQRAALEAVRDWQAGDDTGDEPGTP